MKEGNIVLKLSAYFKPASKIGFEAGLILLYKKENIFQGVIGLKLSNA